MSWNMTGTQVALARHRLSAAASALRTERNRRAMRSSAEKVPEYGLPIAHLPANIVRRTSASKQPDLRCQDPKHQNAEALIARLRADASNGGKNPMHQKDRRCRLLLYADTLGCGRTPYTRAMLATPPAKVASDRTVATEPHTPWRKPGAPAGGQRTEDCRARTPCTYSSVIPHGTPIAAATETAHAPEGTSPCAVPGHASPGRRQRGARQESKTQRRCRKMHADARRWAWGSAVLHGRHRTTEPGEPRRCDRSCPISVHQRASFCICVRPCLLCRTPRRRYSGAAGKTEPHAPETHPCARQFPHNTSPSHTTRNETLVRRSAQRLILAIPTRRSIVSSVAKRDGRETSPASQRGLVRTPARADRGDIPGPGPRLTVMASTPCRGRQDSMHRENRQPLFGAAAGRQPRWQPRVHAPEQLLLPAPVRNGPSAPACRQNPMHLNGPPLSAPDHADAHRRGRTPCTMARISRPTRKRTAKAQLQQVHPQAKRQTPPTAAA
jgi:hypothetical protein